MTDQSNVFEPQSTPTPVTTGNQAPLDTNVLTDQLASIKNPDGTPKYSDMAKALEGLANSQTYIPELKTQLETQNATIATLKEQLAKTDAIEDVVSRLTQAQQTQDTVVTTQNPTLDENAVSDLVHKALDAKSIKDSQASNEALVNNALNQAYGDKANEVVEAKAAELGTTVQGIQELSRTNPKMVLAAFNTQVTPSIQPTTGSVNIPPTNLPDTEIIMPEHSVLSGIGATSKNQGDLMAQIKRKVYKEHGITG